MRITPEQIYFFLHLQFDPQAKSMARDDGILLAKGLNVSPGAAVGMVAFLKKGIHRVRFLPFLDKCGFADHLSMLHERPENPSLFQFLAQVVNKI